ncbi:hypothetical protein HNR71_005464 [Kribbella sandramycini]|uniref:ATP-grasp domain-containing protein n=1 Tax=Kribbella sandramycini TaxID=60450 RepID=A0A841SGT8_9ACTN|nr:hypothetical protein [Kribbella sandramycini]MBB6569827.1 hypothetical protein [Kribbella sandramycini]
MKKILYVYVKGGAPLETAFPRIADCGELHVLALSPLPAAGKESWEPCCTTITVHPGGLTPGEPVVEAIIEHARAIGADALFTLSEFAVLAVANAADRLGLAGAGPGIRAARDKRLMRQAWQAAGVPIPRFRRVDSAADLHGALAAMTPPLLLKPAWGAGSVAQLVLTSTDQVADAWAEIEQALERGGQVGMNELYEPNTDGDRLVEEIADGTTEGWYPDGGYGDYLSRRGHRCQRQVPPAGDHGQAADGPAVHRGRQYVAVRPARGAAAPDRGGLPACGRRARPGHLRHPHRTQTARGRRARGDRGRRPLRRSADHAPGRDRLRPGPDRHADPRTARRAGRLPARDAARRAARGGVGRRRPGQCRG